MDSCFTLIFYYTPCVRPTLFCTLSWHFFYCSERNIKIRANAKYIVEKVFQALAYTQSSFSGNIKFHLALKNSLVIPRVESFPKNEVLKKKKPKTQSHLIHLIPPHKPQLRIFSHFVSNISSASVSTGASARQIPRPQGLSLKWQSMLPPFFIILDVLLLTLLISSAPSICTFQCLHFCLVLHHYNQMLIWMPQHICFKHCTKVCSEVFASKGALLCSEISKACMSLAQGSRD